MEIRKVNEIPPTRGFGVLSEYTIEAMERLSELRVNEILLVPLSEVENPIQKAVLMKKYRSGIWSAKQRLLPRKFSVNKRGDDLYVKRKE